MKIALAADHGGFEMKQMLIARLREAGHEVTDFGAATPDPDDDYPDYIIPLARAVAAGEVDRGIVICGSGVGASVAANKVKGIRAGLCHDHYSVRQGVEDDDMNVLCLLSVAQKRKLRGHGIAVWGGFEPVICFLLRATLSRPAKGTIPNRERRS